MKKKLYGVVLSQNSTEAKMNASEGIKALKSSYGSCLKEDRCPCPHDDKKKAASFLATDAMASKRKCAVGQRPCALGCVNKTLDQPAALVQTGGKVKPGPKDPEDAAIPWSINIHPVKINTFATGRQNLERCFKSCLAATCGCDDAPGMEAIDDLNGAIKANDMAKDPVQDSSPMNQYRHAPIELCGKGMQGKKITKGLYVDLAGGPEGWVEVCSEGFFKALGKAPDVEMRNCASSKALLAGCLWDEVKNECVYGLKKNIRCFERYMDDDKL